MDEKMIAIDGRSLQVSCTGIGPVTLLILSGSNILFPGLEYAPLADALSPWYSVLIPSKFGYGHSGLTDAPRDVDTVVEEYRGVLAALERPLPVVLAENGPGGLFDRSGSAVYLPLCSAPGPAGTMSTAPSAWKKSALMRETCPAATVPRTGPTGSVPPAFRIFGRSFCGLWRRLFSCSIV